VNRAARVALPLAFMLAGGVLLLGAVLAESGSSLAAAALLAALLLAAIADPPVATRAPRRRAVARLVAAVAALVLGTIGVIAALSSGFGLITAWQPMTIAAGAAALVLVAPVVVLARADLDLPIRRAERATLLRGAAVCVSLATGLLIAAYVLPAVDATVGVVFGLLAVLEGVALARPGGAGLRRLATPEELRAVEGAITHGPAEVVGHRRVVVRSTGGADYLSVEVLLRPGVPAGRAQGVRDALEHAVKRALPDLVISVKPIHQPDTGATGPDSDSVLPSAPWTER